MFRVRVLNKSLRVLNKLLFLVNCVIWFVDVTFVLHLKLLAFFKFLQFLIVFHTSVVLEKKNEFLE